MKSKKGLKILLISMIAVVLAASVFVGVIIIKPYQTVAKWEKHMAEVEAVPDSEVLNYFETESEYSYDINDVSKEIDEFYDWSNKASDASQDWIAASEEVPSECEEYFDTVNEVIINFFKDEYSVSVAEELDVFDVKMTYIPEEEAIGGFYYYYMPYEERPEKVGDMTAEEVERTIFLNSSFIENANCDGVWFFEDITGLYIHETLHYLGFMASDISLQSFMEGFTEATTLEILEYGNYEYYTSAYMGNVKLAQQIMSVNRGIVSEMITTDKFADEILIADLTEKLDEEKAKDLGEIHNAINMGFGANNYYDSDYECLEIAQYLTAEYCKNFKLTDKEILEVYDCFIVPVYEI